MSEIHSNWEDTKRKSNYHFDNFKLDKDVDRITYIGRLIGDFKPEVDHAITTSAPSTWRTRGYKGEGKLLPKNDIDSEEKDLEHAGYGKDYVITHLSWNIPNSLKDISTLFGLADCMERIHVQMPGEVWNLHIDKLNKWSPNSPEKVMRIFIQLTDWEQGHFWNFGNHMYSQWHAGDVFTFDWQNLPHSTANAGYSPRVTLQLTGIITPNTEKFINTLKHLKTLML